MSVFVDTNVLLRSVQPSDPSHDLAVRATAWLIESGETLIITPQVGAEFWNALTRPRVNNGLGFSPGQAHRELAQLEGFFTVVSESPEVYREWVNLVTRYSVRGVQAHDARLVAAMKVYTIRRLLTFDTEDFSRYQDIEVIHPQSLGRQP